MIDPDRDPSTKGLKLELIPVEPPISALAMSELVGDGPTLDPWGDESFVCEIDDLY